MSSQKRICQECGSRRFHKDAATGRVVCQSGHVLQVSLALLFCFLKHEQTCQVVTGLCEGNARTG